MGANHSLLALSNSVQALAYKSYTPADHSFWNELWSTDTTPEQLWGCLSSNLVAQIRDAQPANLACLIHKTLGKMTEIVFASKGSLAALKPTHTFQNVYTYSVQNGVPTEPGMQDPVVINSVSVLLNCVRILTRILGVLSENPEDPWWCSYLWGGDLPVLSGAQVAGVDPQLLRGMFLGMPLGRAILLLLLDLLFTEGFAVHISLALPVLNKESLRHNGVQLDALWEVNFSPNTGHAVAGPPNLPNIRQWMQGSQGYSNYDTNRNEVLRCLLVCFCEPIFLPPNTGNPPPLPSPRRAVAKEGGGGVLSFVPNRFLREFVSETGPCARWTPTLCWSLLNVVLNLRPEGTALLQMPYNYAILTDNREPLVEIALHFLLLTLDYRHGEAELPVEEALSQEAREKSVVVLNPPVASEREGSATRSAEGKEASEQDEAAKSLAAVSLSPAGGSAAAGLQASSSTPSSSTSSPAASSSSVRVRHSNVFHAILTELSNGPCLTSIYNNLCRLLLNALMADSTWMPQSLKKIYCFQELLILMWKFADENPHFVPHILNPAPSKPEHACDILMLVTPLLYFVHESRADESQMGLTYTAVFLLLKLSGDREFSVALNRAVPAGNLAHVPFFWLLGLPNITGGTYADALVVVAHELVMSSPTHLDALLKVLLTLLANISPYLTRLSLFAAVKLLKLFDLFASHKFLYANETNHQYAAMMIDIFNNILQYQYQGHSNLVYSILRRARLFQELGRLEPTEEEAAAASAAQASKAAAGASGWNQAAQGTGKRDLHSSAKLPSNVTTTIELAERDSSPQHAPEKSVPMQPAGSASASAVTPGTFVPTAAWQNSWKRQLALEPISRLLDFFQPKVDALLKSWGPNAPIDEGALLSMIGQSTLVGVLPVPHPIVVRRYIPNPYTSLWFSTFLSGVVFLRQQALAALHYGIAAGAPLWNAQAVKMFVIARQQQQEQEAPQQRQQQQQQQLQQPTQQQEQKTPGSSAAVAPADAAQPVGLAGHAKASPPSSPLPQPTHTVQ